MILRLVSSVGSPCEVEAGVGESLSQAIWLSGRVVPQPLCSGLGRCGRCRVRWTADPPAPLSVEEAVLGRDALAEGWRLACRHSVPRYGDVLTLELPPENIQLGMMGEQENPSATFRTETGHAGHCLAVDLGTTSIHWQTVSLQGHDIAVSAQGQMLNPQAGAGADVVSRLSYARSPRGRAHLAGLVRTELGKLCREWEIETICLAANSAMTAIFLETDIEGLCAAPYRLDIRGHTTVRSPQLPPVYIPPLPAPFVGGDISAGLAFLLGSRVPRPFVLADLGTNGELALVTERQELFLTSVPLGPALEGIGPDCGQLAGPDVLTSFSLTPQGLQGYSPDKGNGPARGISATGYLSLLALLCQAGLLDERGFFIERPAMPLARKLAQDICYEHGEKRLYLPRGQWLTASDVEGLLKVKAAFALALEVLLTQAGLVPAQLASLCLAGALAEYIRPDVLSSLGFVPAVLERRIRTVGNTSLAGAALLACRPERRETLATFCSHAHLLPLVDDPDFHHRYLRHMRFGC